MSFFNKMKKFINANKKESNKEESRQSERETVNVKPKPHEEQNDLSKEPKITVVGVSEIDTFPAYLGIGFRPTKTNKLRYLYKDKIDPMKNQVYDSQQAQGRLRVKYYANKFDHLDLPLVKPIANDTPKEKIKYDIQHPETTKTWKSPISGRYECGITKNWKQMPKHVAMTNQDYDELMEVTSTNHKVGCAYMLGINYDKGIQNNAIDVITGLPIPAKDLNEFMDNYHKSKTKYEDCHNLFEKQLLTIKCAPKSIHEELALLVLKGDNDPSPRTKNINTNDKHFNSNGYLNPFEVAYQFGNPKDLWREFYNSTNTRILYKQSKLYLSVNRPIRFAPAVSPQALYETNNALSLQITENQKRLYRIKINETLSDLYKSMQETYDSLIEDIDKIFEATQPARDKFKNQPYQNLWEQYMGNPRDLDCILNTDKIVNFSHTFKDEQPINPKIKYSFDFEYSQRFYKDDARNYIPVNKNENKVRFPFASAIRNDVLNRLSANGLAATWKQDHQNYPHLLDDWNIPYQLDQPNWQKYPEYANPSYVEEIINLTYISVLTKLPNLNQRFSQDADAYREIMQTPIMSDSSKMIKYRDWATNDLKIRQPYLAKHDLHLYDFSHPYQYHNLNEQAINDSPWDPTTMMQSEDKRQYAQKQQETMAKYKNPYESLRQQEEQISELKMERDYARSRSDDLNQNLNDAQKQNKQLEEKVKNQKHDMENAKRRNRDLQDQLDDAYECNDKLHEAWQNQKAKNKEQENKLNQQIDKLKQDNQTLRSKYETEHLRAETAESQRTAAYNNGVQAGRRR